MAKRRYDSVSPSTKPAGAPAPLTARKSKTRKTASPGPAFAPDLSLSVSYVSPSDLTEYAGNPRTHSPDQIEKIAESIKAFGFVSPLIVDPDSELIAMAASRRQSSSVSNAFLLFTSIT
jgi:hypothetical protein